MLTLLLLLPALAADPVPAPVEPPPPPTWETLVRAVLTEVAPDRADQLQFGPLPDTTTFDDQWDPAPASAPARLGVLKALALARGTEDLAVADADLAAAERLDGQVVITDATLHVDIDPAAPIDAWRPALQLAWELASELKHTAPTLPSTEPQLAHEAGRAARATALAQAARDGWEPARAVVATLLPEAPLPDTLPARLPIAVPHPEIVPGKHLSPSARRATVRALTRAYLSEATPELVRQAHKRANGREVETLAHPVCTSNQVLHPDQSLTTGLQPLFPTVRKIDKLLPKRALVHDGVIGEAFWRALFATWFGEELAKLSTEGWTGDRLLLFRDTTTGEQSLLVFTTFTTELTAAAFAERLRAWFKTSEVDGGSIMHESTRVLFARHLPEKDLTRLVDRIWLTLELPAQACGPRPPE